MSAHTHVIACGVLALDIEALKRELPGTISAEYLPGGLHENPRELRARLQEAIDNASARHAGDRLALGYGACGMGTVGLTARNIPLAIPRVHDCIALFLGSDAAYREQFSRYPGTYYISAGWVAEKAQPLSSPGAAAPEDDPDYRRLLEQYGPENAEAVRYFLSSWQRNYQRAAFIDTGAGSGREHLEAAARRLSQEFGWQYEALQGSRALLRKLLTALLTDDDILVVPPHYTTVYDAAGRRLAARPAWVADTGSAHGHTLILDGPPDGAAPDTPPDTPPGIGLGLDAGGTYTDAAVYDFATRRVLGQAKALTTNWDYTVGIGRALDGLDPALLGRVELVALSTTLATNAIVEDRGQPVGLLIMPPYGLFDENDIAHRPLAVLDGRLEIDGTELAPLDTAAVRTVVRDMVRRHRVGAFAVCGYASHVNPAHELAVKQIVREECGLGVTCGHEVSEGVNYRVRAVTAALNGRIVPLLERLIDDTQALLARRGLQAPVMVVRSDGSLMNARTARERPVETLLSGPAASVAGARYLCGAADAIVVDMGGTTTDTAVIQDGQVRTNPDGTTIGGHQTHVRALDMRTLGLGGDSRVLAERRHLRLGPRRVAPVAWLAHHGPDPAGALDWLEHRLDRFENSTGAMELLVRTDPRPLPDADPREAAVLEALADGPLSLDALADRTGIAYWEFLPLARLENAHRIQRCGLTPTDVLHAAGELRLWAPDTSTRYCRLIASLLGLSLEAFCQTVRRLVEEQLTLAILKTQLAEESDPDTLDRDPAAQALLRNLLDGGSPGYRLALSLQRPVIGIGAPTHFFLPGAARRLGTDALTPPHADVANAVGAITSQVCIRRRVEVFPNDTGRYSVSGIDGAPTFDTLDEATRFAIETLRRRVLALARQAGTENTRVEIALQNRAAALTDGSDFFIGRRIEASLTGTPSLRLVH